jgi:hypothetical protein
MAARFPVSSSSVGYRIKAAYSSKVLAIYWPASADSVHRLYSADTATTIITRSTSGAGIFEARLTGDVKGSAGVYFSDSQASGLGTTEGGSCTYIASGYGDMFNGIGDPWIMGCAAPMDAFNNRMSIKGATYNMDFQRPGASLGSNNVGGGDDVLGFMVFGVRHVAADPTARYRVWANGAEVVGLRSTSAPASSVTVGDTSNALRFGGSSGGTGNTRFEAECWIVATDLTDAEMDAITADPSIVIEATGGGDTTAPVLSSPVGTATGATTATVGATTDEGNGTLYVVVTTSATQPSIAQIKAGNDHTGSAAVFDDSQTVTSTGAKTFSATGLTASTTYYAHLVHTDAASNDSNRVSSSSFTTSAAGGATIPLTSHPLRYFVSADIGSIAGRVSRAYRVQVYAVGTTLGTPLYTSGSTMTTDANAELADITDAAFTASTQYKVALTDQTDNNTYCFITTAV